LAHHAADVVVCERSTHNYFIEVKSTANLHSTISYIRSSPMNKFKSFPIVVLLFFLTRVENMKAKSKEFNAHFTSFGLMNFISF
jgi:hypothetical protein